MSVAGKVRKKYRWYCAVMAVLAVLLQLAATVACTSVGGPERDHSNVFAVATFFGPYPLEQHELSMALGVQDGESGASQEGGARYSISGAADMSAAYDLVTLAGDRQAPTPPPEASTDYVGAPTDELASTGFSISPQKPPPRSAQQA